MPKQYQGNIRDDASAAMMPALQRRQWQQCQGDVRKGASAATAMMPKRPQGDVRNDASVAMMALP